MKTQQNQFKYKSNKEIGKIHKNDNISNKKTYQNPIKHKYQKYMNIYKKCNSYMYNKNENKKNNNHKILFKF